MNLQQLKNWVGRQQLVATGEDREGFRCMGWLLMHQDAWSMARIRRDLWLAERHAELLAEKARADDWHRTYRP